MSSANTAAKHVLCTGIAVLDLVFRVPHFPRPDVKTQATAFETINGGNGANAAVAIAHLGARASFAGPLGGPPSVIEKRPRLSGRSDLTTTFFVHETRRLIVIFWIGVPSGRTT